MANATLDWRLADHFSMFLTAESRSKLVQPLQTNAARLNAELERAMTNPDIAEKLRPYAAPVQEKLKPFLPPTTRPAGAP